MEVQTIQKFIHTSPRKLRLVADVVRTMQPTHALDVLRVTPKYAAKDMTKALETVLANAKQSGLDIEKVEFKKIEIDESMKMRRFKAGTRGRVKPFKRRMAHIKIVLTDEKVSQVEKVPQVPQGETKEETPRDTRGTRKSRGTLGKGDK